MSGQKFSRRTLLRTALLAGGALALTPLAQACAPAPSPAGPAGGAAKPTFAGKLQMKGWNYKPEIVQEHVDIYKRLYGDNLEYELIPANYDAVMETKFIGGQQVDMNYIFPERIQRWRQAGWIRDLEGLPGVDELKKAMFPIEVEKFSGLDGKLGALPYFTAWFIMAYNEVHIERLGRGWKPPATWEEFLEVCRKLQKDGIAKHPYVPMWRPSPSFFNDQMFTDMYSEGEPIFDKDFTPTFKDGGVAFRKVFELYRTLWNEQLVPPDAFTLDGRVTFATGEHTFFSFVVYGLPEVNDPTKSKIAGKVRLMPYPGKTGEVLTVGGGYAMGAKPQDTDAAWELLKFFGSKAKDGTYVVAKRWALLAGLPSAYPDVMNDPEVVANYATTWGDIDAAKRQQLKVRARPVDKTLWFAEWANHAMTKGGDYITGKIQIGELLKTLDDKVTELRKTYG